MFDCKALTKAGPLPAKLYCWLVALIAITFTLPAFAAPIAVDDNVAVPSNTTVFANDLAANDTTVATDTYTITVPPTNGTATLTTDGFLDYTPNIGFANLDSFTYSIDDGVGGIATATVTLDVVLTSDFLTPASNFIIGQEDVPTPLNLTVDPSLEFGGTLQDVIGVDALYRAENLGGSAVSSTIPIGATGINVTGYGTINVDTGQVDEYNDDYELISINVDLRNGTYSGRLTYSVNPNQANNTIDQYTWLNVPLGQSVLSNTSLVDGHWTGNADPMVELVAGQLRITDTVPLQIAYHIEYMSSDGDSADFISGSGDVQVPGDFQSNFTIPLELEPTDGSQQGYIVMTGNSAANGANFREENKGFSRMVVDLEAKTVSGVIASERGETDARVTTWAFTDYPLIDLRSTPAASPVSITNSSANTNGDTTASVTSVEDDPTVYIDASGSLAVERATDHAGAFTTMYTTENYQRTGLSSIASFVGVESDTSLFDSSPPDEVDENGKPVNLQTFEIPASSSIGIVQMSWQTIGGDAENENVGYGFAVIDLNKETSSGSIVFSRTTSPDLVSWQGVPIGTTMFGATDGGVDIFQSNRVAGGFRDGYAETARFSLIDNPDGSRTLELTATSNAGTGSFADYLGTTQISWLGSEPFRVEGVPGTGVLSHGSPIDGGGWEVDFADIPLLAISTNAHETGELELELVLASTGEVDTIIVHVEPVVDDPVLTANDVVGYLDNPTSLAISVADSADVDGSETQLQMLTLSGVPTSVTLAASAGTVTNFGGGNWEVNDTALATLIATGPTATTATITVSGTNTDTDDLDRDSVIEDTNNGAGVDELDSAVYTQTFELSILSLPTVTSQFSSTGTPIISGTANVGPDETLSVTVNGVTYTAGDGDLVDNGDGTWDLTIPSGNTIADGTYMVSASLDHVSGSMGVDLTTDELIVDSSPPAIPTVTSLVTSDATPIITGTATVASDEILNVTIDGITYTAGDGNLVDNGDGTWTLSVSTPLAENTYNVTATVTDPAGNVSTDISAGELEVEATPLATPTVVPLTTTNTSPTITGGAMVGTGATLTVTVDGVTYTNGDGNLTYSGGTWTLAIPTTLADNTYEVIATVTDVFGNAFPDTSSNELIVDTTAPVIPTVISQTTNITSPIISGTATVGLGETLAVTVDGITYTAGDGNLVDNGDGTWDLTIPTTLAENTYSVTTTVTDAAGNIATDTSVDELIIDTTPPIIPTVVFQTTSNTTPIISGTATVAAGETLTVSVAGTTYTAGDGNLIDNGDGTWDLTIPTALADGNYSVTATVFDIAGNASADATALELSIDTAPPVTPTVASQSTNSTSPTITGTSTVAPGDILTVSVDGVTYTAGDGYLFDNGDGTWALMLPATLDQGTYDVVATVTDPAGNATSDTTVGELVIDLTAPVAPGVTSLATTDTTPIIEGTAILSPGEILRVEVNGVIYTAGDGNLVLNGDDTWSLTIPATNILTEGLYQVIATVTDAAGNSAIDSGVDDLLIDLTAPNAPGVTSQTTNDTTPLIEGTATLVPGETLTVIVNGVTYTAGDGNLVDNNDGTWALSIPTQILEGLYDVTATITDAAGNLSTDPSSNELLIDTTLPITPTTTPLITSNTTPTISGTANAGPGETLTVEVNGVVYTVGDGNLVDNGDGTWDLTFTTPQPDGTYEVIASVTDAAGNISTDTNSDELVIDTTAPIAPTINALITNTDAPVLTGTTSIIPGETLSVTVNSVTYNEGDGNLVVNADGTWDLVIPAANAMADGVYEVSATTTDIAGNSTSDSSTGELTIDTDVPVIPTVTAQITNNATPVISGTATVASDETLSVTVNGITYTVGDGNLVNNGDGTWDLTIPSPLPDTTYPVTVNVTDTAGNVSVDTTVAELIIDTTPPAIPTVVSQVTNINTPVITGTATVGANDVLTVSVDSISYTAGDGNLVDNSNGIWSLTIPTPMVDGSYEVIATVSDNAGNSTTDATALELIIDTVAPAIPTITPLITSNSTPTISGTATVGLNELLTVIVDGVTYTAGDGNLIDNGDDTWDLTIPTALAEATYEVIATVTDAAGNSSADESVGELIVDITPPVVPTVVSQTTNNTTPTISGTATVSADETLSVTVDGTTYVAGDGNLIDNGDGTWDLAITTALAEATYDVIATVTDAAGNASVDTSAGELIIDITAPAAPGVTSLTTMDTTPIIMGTATVGAGETLTVDVNGVTYTAGDGNLVDNGDGTWNLTIPAADVLAENLYQVIATVTDAAGNSSIDSGADDLLIDLTAPNAPGVTSQTTNNTTPTIQGTATIGAGETLSVDVNGITYIAGAGNLVVNVDGTWTLSIPIALAEGLYDVNATITDLAGNISTDPSSGELLIDTTLPLVPSTTPLTTNDTTPVLSGTANAGPGETLSVEVDGVVYTAGDGKLIDNGDGTWDLTIPTALAEATYEVTATVTDAAGNASVDVTVDELIIDTTAPSVPTATALTTNITTPVISGTATTIPGDVLTVSVDGITYTAGDGFLVDNADGTWSLSIPTPLAEGVFDVSVTITDAAGNIANDTTLGELTIDLTAPVAPDVTNLITMDTTPLISGIATIDAGDVLTVEVDGVTYVAGDGNLTDNGDGTWMLVIPAGNLLAEALFQVIATVTDAAGNNALDISVNDLLVDLTDPVVPSVVSQTTNNTTPTINGTAIIAPGETLSVTVNGITYTVGDGNLVDNGDGTWDLTIPTALAEATYEVTATVIDAAGNSSTDVSIGELIVDITPPVVPTVVSQTTNNTSPTITGTATVAVDETLSVTVDGATYTAGDGNLVDNGDGTWDLTIPTALAEATYEVTATVTDAAGNSSVDVTVDELIVDTTAPPVPTATALTTNITTPVIAGTATTIPGDVLTVSVDGITYTAADGFLVDNADGTWSLSIPTPLAEGVFDVSVTITDTAGNSSTDATAGELTIDLTAPVAPDVTNLITMDTTPLISGIATITPGDVLTVEVDGVTYVAGDGNLTDNGDGTWMLVIPAGNSLTEAVFQVIATVTDAAGNNALDISVNDLLVDLTDPVVPSVVSQTTNNTTPVINGTAITAAGETLSVMVNGATYTVGDGNLVDNGDDTWDLTIPTALAEATYEVIATVTDAAGNSSTDVSIDELIIDITPPVVPTVVSQTTNNTTPTITGTATVAVDETLNVTVDGTTYVAGDGNLVDNSDGTWGLSISVPLAEAAYDVSATVTDLAGNASIDTTAGELIIDITAPVAPGVTSLTTMDTTPIIMGTATVGVGETLSVEVNGVTYTAGDGNLVDNGDGTWNLTIPAADVLAENLYQVIATVTDAAGNSSIDSGADDLLVDLTAPNAPGATGQTTSNTTPTIQGMATLDAGETLSVEVNGITYTVGDGNLVDNGDGTWTLSIPVALAEGLYDVTATITDLAGNISTDPSSGELLIDTTLPLVPSTTPLTTNDTTPVVSGTANVGSSEVLSVEVDGVVYTAGDGNLVDNGDGTWDLTIITPLAEGTYDVITTVTDAAGNASVDVTVDELIIDTTAPPVPTATALTTNLTTPVIAGTATTIPGDTLTVSVDGTFYTAGDGFLVDNADGTWSLSIPTTLAEGVFDVIVTVTDAAGNSSTDATAGELTIDLTAPVAPDVTNLITMDTTPLISGIATIGAGDVLTVEVDGVIYVAGDGNLTDNGDGTWMLVIPAGNLLAEALFQVIATVTDAAGNNALDISVNDLLVDLTAPIVPSVMSQTTNNTTPVINGTAIIAADETLSVTVNGVTYTVGDGNLVDNGDGTWDLTIPTALAEATYEVTATVTDAAGNSSTDVSIGELIVDITPPVVPTVVSQTTNNTTPTITGTATVAVDETLSVTVDGATYTAGDGSLVDNGDDTWDLTIPTALAEATYEVIATVTDAAGNASVDVTVDELIIDTTAPPVPTATALTTNITTPIISGTATTIAGDTLTVSVDGITYTAGDGFLVDNADGTWSLSIPTPLAEGVFDVIVTITDTAGNSSTDTTSGELIIDTTAPFVPTVAPLSTNINTPTLMGTAAVGPGEILQITVDGVTYTAGDGNLVDNGDGTWTLAIPTALVDDNYPVTVTITDIAGNSSVDATTTELTVDTSSPFAPTVAPQITNNTTPLIEGTATLAPGETLTVSVNGVTYTAGDGNLVDNGDGTWTLTIPTPLPEGTFDVAVTVTDAAGNTSTDTSSGELVIDTQAPAAPTVDAQNSNSASPTITGTAIVGPGETLTVTVDGVTYLAGDGFLVDNGDGTWSLSLPVALAEGVYDVIATVTDAAGNVTSDASVGELVIDLSAPVAPGVTSLATMDTTPVIQGTAIVGLGETLSVEVNGVVYTVSDGNLIDNSDGTWMLTIPASDLLVENLYDVTATVTDAAGNSATDAGVNELLVDLTSPNAPGITSQTTNNVTPVIQGTANLAPGETLAVTVNGITYTVGDGNLVDNGDGTWTLTIPTPLPEGLYDVVAAIIDSAGNISTDPSAGELLIDTTLPTTPTTTPLVTANAMPMISGTANVGPGETLTVTINGVTYTAGDGNLVDNGDGTWTLTLPTILPDGVYEVTTTITDAAGNSTSDTGSGELVIDTTAPPVPTVESQVTEDTTPTISGTAIVAPGDTLTVTIDGFTYTAGDGSLVDNGDGTWTLTLATPLPVGDYPVQVAVTDAAGNTALSALGQLSIQAPPIEDDFDADGIPDSIDLDDDNDGIPDTVEGILDSDGDGQPDFQDLDSDNDGIADIVEVGGDDENNDYLVDSFVDADNNGLSDDLQLFPFELVDTDNDRVADFRDVDSDNDGLTDLLESGGIDSDNNGRIDNFSDNNNDGADDENQLSDAAGRDTDGDGIPNRLDLDSDNDELFDLVESGSSDQFNDGILDSQRDSDFDGIPDTVDVDSTAGIDADNDGIDDLFDASFVDELDTDSDGIVDSADADLNGDGFAEVVSNSLALGQALPDTNGNGIEDVLEPVEPAPALQEAEAIEEGKIHIGLRGTGSGCSITRHAIGTASVDPMLLLLIVLSMGYLLRRRTWGLQ